MTSCDIVSNVGNKSVMVHVMTDSDTNYCYSVCRHVDNTVDANTCNLALLVLVVAAVVVTCTGLVVLGAVLAFVDGVVPLVVLVLLVILVVGPC